MRRSRPPGTPRRYTGRASFLKVAAEVEEAIRAGFTLTAIYERRRGRLGMSYRSFARYAREHLTGRGGFTGPGLTTLVRATAPPGPAARRGLQGAPVGRVGEATKKSVAGEAATSVAPAAHEREPLEITLGPTHPRMHDPTATKGLV